MCRYADLVIAEEDWFRKRRDIVSYGVDLFIMGDDWAGKFDDLREPCEVRYPPRTQDISTSELKRAIRAGG